MRNTFWFAVDYDGTGHIPQGAFKEMFPGITWQDIPIAVTLEVLPREETFWLRLSKSCSYLFRKYIRIPRKGE